MTVHDLMNALKGYNPQSVVVIKDADTERFLHIINVDIDDRNDNNYFLVLSSDYSHEVE